MTSPDHAPRVDARYGAPQGRRLRPSSVAAGRDAWAEDTDQRRAAKLAEQISRFTGKVSLRRIRLNSGGYDRGGAYWGHGQPLYSALSECGTIDQIGRFADRAAARAWVLEIAPGAKVRP